MALNYTTDLLDRLDTLEELYRVSYIDGGDLKLLQGVERCIELRMKLLGFDGKSAAAAPVAAESIVSIDLKKLSNETLKEIIHLTQEGVKDTL